MNREDIIRMAQECQLIGMRPHLDGIYQESLELFFQSAYNAGAAAERARQEADAVHSCGPDCQRPGCVREKKARADEREACAKVCEDEIKRVKPIYSVVAENVLKAIRARGNT